MNDPLMRIRYYRFYGWLFGASLGLIYGVVSQTVNPLFFPGLSFYQPPFGIAGNILVSFLLGALISLLTCWPESTPRGVLQGSLASAAVVQLSTLVTGGTDPELVAGKLVSMVFLFLPIAAVLAPLVFLVRWEVNRQSEARSVSFLSFRRLALVLPLALLAVILGGLELHPTTARQPLYRMDALIRKNLGVRDVKQLSPQLQPPRVEGFLSRAHGNYSLDWQNRGLTRYALAYPVGAEDRASVVLAYFDNGWILGCLFVLEDESATECRDYASFWPFRLYSE